MESSVAVEAQRHERTDEFAKGLRLLADWYEQHPGCDRIPQFDCTIFCVDGDEFAEARDAIGDTAERSSAYYIGVERDLSANVRLRAIKARLKVSS